MAKKTSKASNKNATSPSRKSPLMLVKEQYGSKDKLVDKATSLLDAEEGESNDEFKARLKLVPNRKLMHAVKELGGRDAIVKKIAELRGQAKDFPYQDKLKGYTTGRLVDMLGSLERRAAGKAKRPPKHQRRRRG